MMIFSTYRKEILIVILIFLAACTQSNVQHVKIGNLTINVTIADSDDERARGLMEVSNLDQNSGMLFIFEDDQIRYFWMKNTLIPLDIIFVSKDKKIVSFLEDLQPCNEFICPSFSSREPARYAIEVNAGYVKRHNLKIGQDVEI